MKINLLKYFIILMTGISVPAYAGGREPDPIKINAMIARTGATKTIAQLKRTGEWDNVVAGIPRGGQIRVEMAVKLLKGSDAGDTEDLKRAISMSLAEDPKPVLTAFGKRELDINHICSPLMIEPTNEEIRSFVDKATERLSSVKNGLEAVLAGKCIGELKRYSK